MDWLDLFVGAAIGALASLAIWWVQYRLIVPKLAFSSEISKVSDEDGSIYRVKITNKSRWRTVIDCHFEARLYLGNGVVAYSEGPVKTLQSLDVQAIPSTVMRMRPARSQLIRLDLRKTTWSNADPRYRRIAGIDDCLTDSVPLELLMAGEPRPYLCVLVLAYDEITGSRKFFVSGRYHASSIKRGRFSGLEVSPYVPPQDESPTAG